MTTPARDGKDAGNMPEVSSPLGPAEDEKQPRVELLFGVPFADRVV